MTEETSAQEVFSAVLCPIVETDVFVATCALNKVRALVVQTDDGALAVLDNASQGSANTAANSLSRVFRGRPMLAIERVAGQVTAFTWTDGVQSDPIPLALAIDQASDKVTSLVTGAQTVQQLQEEDPKSVQHTNFGRWKAFGVLRRFAKEQRRRAQAK